MDQIRSREGCIWQEEEKEEGGEEEETKNLHSINGQLSEVEQGKNFFLNLNHLSPEGWRDFPGFLAVEPGALIKQAVWLVKWPVKWRAVLLAIRSAILSQFG